MLARTCPIRAANLRVDLTTLLRKRTLQRAEQQNDQPGGGTGAHQPDTPDLSCERAKTCPDLDVVFLQEMFPHRRLVHAVWYAHGIERPETLAMRWQDRQSQLFQAVEQRLVVSFVPRPPGVESFFFDQGKCLVERVHK